MARNEKIGARWIPAALLSLSILTAGCVRRTVSAIFPKQRASPRAKLQKPLTPDESFRQTIQQQSQGAFNPLTEDRSIKMLQTRLRLDPTDATSRMQLAATFERYSLYDDALEQYKQVLSIGLQDADNSVRKNEVAAAAAEGLGRCAQASSRGPEAIPILSAFVRRSPVGGVYDELGKLYEQASDIPAAEQAFRQAVTMQPNSDRMHNNLGYNLLLQKQPEAAEGEFRRALELNPKSVTARNNLGAILAGRGDLDGAFQQFRLASADVATAHNNLAVVLLELGRYERGRDELVKALSAHFYFAQPLENFKLVQKLLRQRADLVATGGSLPLQSINLPPSIASARFDPTFETTVAPNSLLPTKEGSVELKVSEDAL